MKLPNTKILENHIFLLCWTGIFLKGSGKTNFVYFISQGGKIYLKIFIIEASSVVVSLYLQEIQLNTLK
jgi:hypothetical protein